MWWFGFHFSHTRVRVSVAPQLLGGLAAELQQAAPRPAGRARGLPRRHPSSGVQLERRVTKYDPKMGCPMERRTKTCGALVSF